MSKFKYGRMVALAVLTVGRRGPVPWPPQSPDLTPLDFFLWGHKSLVYETPVETQKELIAKILAARLVVQQN
jgi:hypothetical protein